MRKFTYDVESVSLSWRECAAYVSIVHEECGGGSAQHSVSIILSWVTKPGSGRLISEQDVALIWRPTAGR